MAISRHHLERELEDYCKKAWDEARRRGDFQRADEIRNLFDMKMEEIMTNTYDPYQNALMLQQANNATGQQYQNALAQQQQVYGTGALSGTTTGRITSAQPFNLELGVLYLNNAELPADWSGAKITDTKRTVDSSTRWLVLFTSKWDKALEIRLYLDMEEINGKEANAMAETFKEALNQRRSG